MLKFSIKCENCNVETQSTYFTQLSEACNFCANRSFHSHNLCKKCIKIINSVNLNNPQFKKSKL